MDVDGRLAGILDIGLRNIVGSHLVLAGNRFPGSPGRALVGRQDVRVEVVCLLFGPHDGSVARIIVRQVIDLGPRGACTGRASGGLIFHPEGFLETGVVDLVREYVKSGIVGDIGRRGLGIVSPNPGRDALPGTGIIGGAEDVDTGAVAVAVQTDRINRIVNGLRGQFRGPVTQLVLEHQAIVIVKRVGIDDHRGIEDGGIQVGGAGTLVQHT